MDKRDTLRFLIRSAVAEAVAAGDPVGNPFEGSFDRPTFARDKLVSVLTDGSDAIVVLDEMIAGGFGNE